MFFRAVHTGTKDRYSAQQRAAWAPDAPEDAALWAQRVTAGTALGAFGWGKLKGFMTMGDDGHIDFAYVDPTVMGKGVALRLYGALEAEARRQSHVVLTTEASHLAKRFFEKRGWAVEAAQTVIRDGIGIENFRMSKSL